MALTPGPHYYAGKKLLPRCIAPDGALDKVLRISGKHFDDARTIEQELYTEMFPDTTRTSGESTYGLIEWWERVYQITPPAGATASERRAALLAKYRALGGVNEAYFLMLADALGYNTGIGAGDPHLRITEGDFPPFRCDLDQLDIDILWDQEEGQTSATWAVRGTDVESDTVLQELFESLKPLGTSILYINE